MGLCASFGILGIPGVLETPKKQQPSQNPPVSKTEEEKIAQVPEVPPLPESPVSVTMQTSVKKSNPRPTRH